MIDSRCRLQGYVQAETEQVQPCVPPGIMDKLILGTVQLGLPYGINNTQGQPTSLQAHTLLNAAYQKGFRCLDTAEAYGNAQEVIGDYHRLDRANRFAVITKYKGGQVFSRGSDFRKHFLRCLETLNVPALEAYLFHSFDVYKAFSYWDEVKALKKDACLQRIGVSVYTNEQAAEVAKDEQIEVVQLPYNLLDNFHLRGSTLALLREFGKEVHIRSVFLQGLFYKNRHQLGRLSTLKESLEKLDELAGESNVDIGTLALAYCLRQPFIDRVLIGMETEAQLNQNMEMLAGINLIDDSVFEQVHSIQTADKALLHPTNW